MVKTFSKSSIISSLNCTCETHREFFAPYCEYTQGVFDGLMCIADDFGISYERSETFCRFFDREDTNESR